MDELRDKLAPLYRRLTPAQDRCPSPERLARLVAGTVWPWQRRRLVHHLAVCSDCADDCRTLLAARDGLSLSLGVENENAPAPLAVGVATAAALGMFVLTAALVFERDFTDSAPRFESDTIFASNFDPTDGEARPDAASGDVLFTSDFDGDGPETTTGS